MLDTTRDSVKATIEAVCVLDPSVSRAQISAAVDAAVAELSGKGVREMRGEPPPRAYSPAEVAELLGKSRRTISAYARRGLLTPIYSGETGARAQGYSGESVSAFLSGKVKAKGSEVRV